MNPKQRYLAGLGGDSINSAPVDFSKINLAQPKPMLPGLGGGAVPSNMGATATQPVISTAPKSPAKQQYIQSQVQNIDPNANPSPVQQPQTPSQPPTGTANGYVAPPDPNAAYRSAFDTYLQFLKPSEAENTARTAYTNIARAASDSITGAKNRPGDTQEGSVAEANRLSDTYKPILDNLSDTLSGFTAQDTANGNIAKARADYEKSLLPSGDENGFSLSPGETRYDAKGNAIATSKQSGAPKIIGSASSGYYTVNSDGSIESLGIGGGGGESNGVTTGAPTSYKEWELAGGQAGTGKTYNQFLADSNVKAPTQAQQTVGTYATRLEQANPLIDNAVQAISSMNPIVFEAQRKLPSYLQTPTYQAFDQAARNFINAVLRRESGAVISPSEFDNAYKQYLPRAGDNKDTLAQKKQNRDIVYQSFKKAAGSAYQGVDELLGSGTTDLNALRSQYGY